MTISAGQVVQLGHETRLLEVPRRDSSLALNFLRPCADVLVVRIVDSWSSLSTHPGFYHSFMFSPAAAGLIAIKSRGGRAIQVSDLP